jgi:hypothetical protein
LAAKRSAGRRLKKGGRGTAIDVPLHGKDDEWDFALLDSIEVSVDDAPAGREIVIVVALASGGRARARTGVSREYRSNRCRPCSCWPRLR